MSFKTYKATSAIVLHSGNVKISDDQFKRRRHALKELEDKGHYSIVPGPVTFKAGEKFGYDGEIPKGLWDAVADADTVTKRNGSGKRKAQ